jgi:hypothetical protein
METTEGDASRGAPPQIFEDRTMKTTELMTAFSCCPKCGLMPCVLLKHCRGCDDSIELEHLHKGCLCGYVRMEKCPTPAVIERFNCRGTPAFPGFLKRLWQALKYVAKVR